MPTSASIDATRAWALLSNGVGGIDWSGLPVVCQHLGIDDPGRLIDGFYVLKTHKTERSKEGEP